MDITWRFDSYMVVTIDFEIFNTGKRRRKSNYIDPFEGIKWPYPVVFNILTLCMAKIPYIAAKKNKKNLFFQKPVISSVSGPKSSEITDIAIKKIKKCLTFNICCANNKLAVKMKNKTERIYGDIEWQ
jgi:hypothetical protein